ncbi:helix-turn-helix domain-containing protein [Nonomuraea sp. NPDC050790]|uniref:helix-turn-helix domain-containing protein n=1 Tax=Nonomuraea sp. NPDC050790 TaxID=3364371 RepID=UPI00379ADA7E
MIFLDTDDVDPADRLDAFNTIMRAACEPCHLLHEDPTAPVRARTMLMPLSRSTLHTAHTSGFTLLRTPRHVAMDSPPVVALALQTAGQGRFDQLGRQRTVGRRELMLNDLTSPYEFGWSGHGASQAFIVGYDVLGLPVDVVRRAAPRLTASPLYELVRHHFDTLARLAPGLAHTPGLDALETAGIELMRALIISVTGEEGRRPPEPLLTTILAHIRHNLAAPDLTPAGVAAAHGISPRQLYKLCDQAGISLEQWIITQRLEGARRELATPGGRAIASVARAWGFTSASHFTRRFRQAYGLSPRQWRQSNQE